jgi:hypothetical protein
VNDVRDDATVTTYGPEAVLQRYSAGVTACRQAWMRAARLRIETRVALADNPLTALTEIRRNMTPAQRNDAACDGLDASVVS